MDARFILEKHLQLRSTLWNSLKEGCAVLSRCHLAGEARPQGAELFVCCCSDRVRVKQDGVNISSSSPAGAPMRGRGKRTPSDHLAIAEQTIGTNARAALLVLHLGYERNSVREGNFVGSILDSLFKICLLRWALDSAHGRFENATVNVRLKKKILSATILDDVATRQNFHLGYNLAM